MLQVLLELASTAPTQPQRNMSFTVGLASPQDQLSVETMVKEITERKVK